MGEWDAIVKVLSGFDEAPPPPPATPITPALRINGVSLLDRDLPTNLPSMETVLSSLGFDHVRDEDRGSLWRHPNSTNEWSVRVNRNGRLHVFSSSLPMAASGELGERTYDVIEVIAAYRFGRTPTTADCGVILGEYRRDQRPAAERGAGASSQAAEPGPATPSLNLSDEFWESRPYLSHIYQAALASLVSPDALWEAVKCFYGATIPWNHRLPGDGTMDYISIVVGASGGGKTSAKQEALNLLVDARKLEDVALALPPGSGEGMTEVYLDRSDDDNKYRFRGCGFYGDEGKWLLDVNARAGNTTMQVLKQAWSGELTGSVAATAERHRWLAPRDVRSTVLISATPDVAAAFMRQDLSDGGLPQRISWGWAHYPHPDDPPEHPGPLSIPLFESTRSNPNLQVCDLEPELAALIRARRLAGARGESDDALEGHATYATLKGAAILAHLDGRRTIMMSDWTLGNLDWETSARIRGHLLRTTEQSAQERHRAAGVARAYSKLAETDVYLEKAVISLVAKVKKSKEGLTRRQVKDHLRTHKLKHGIDHREVLDLALGRELLEIEGGFVHAR